jgi:biopolymer transport protein ExbD
MCSFHFKQVQGTISTWLPKDYGPFRGRVAVIAPDEVEVVVGRRDGVTTRKVQGLAECRSDEDLAAALESRASDYAKVGNTTWKLIIESASDVPWQDVVHVMDLCKRLGIERLELTAPRRPL